MVQTARIQGMFLPQSSPKRWRKWESATSWSETRIPGLALHGNISPTGWRGSSPISFSFLQCIFLQGQWQILWPVLVCSSWQSYQWSTSKLGALRHFVWRLPCSPTSLSPHRHRCPLFVAPRRDLQPSLGKNPNGLVLACSIQWSDGSASDLQWCTYPTIGNRHGSTTGGA